VNRLRSIIALGFSNPRNSTNNRIRSGEMNKSRSYFKLVEALKESECPICRLVLEDSRAYLDHLLYESVLDVPIRMMLRESFGFCSWHARQIASLPPICSPSEGFAIFASDLLRKLDYVSRAIIEQGGRHWKWKSWFRKNRGRLLALLKQRACPVCDHVKQFETYHLNDLMDAIGDEEILSAYKTSQGICLPHLLILEEVYSSHANFSLFFEAQLAKTKALRVTLEEFIRKQDFRFRDQITPEEAKSPRAAMEFLVGKPGVFANEMGHDLFQRARKGSLHYGSPALTRLPTESYSLRELVDEFRISKQATFYLKKPLPPELFDALKELAEEHSGPAIEAVVEELNDIEYLYRLHSAGFSIFYGIGLPPQTIILLDGKRGFVLEGREWHLRMLKNPQDLYLSLLWHKFGIAVLLTGCVKETDAKNKLFCIAVKGKREQWCRFRDSVTKKIPRVGINVEIFGWDKWNTPIVEVLELKELQAIRK